MTQQAGLFDAPQELPQGLLYEPDFLTREEEDALVAAIAPLPLREAKFREYFAKRRVAHFHNDGDTPYYDDGDADSFTSGPLPPFLVEVREKLARRLSRPPEDFVHALVVGVVTDLCRTRIGLRLEVPVDHSARIDDRFVVGLEVRGR